MRSRHPERRATYQRTGRVAWLRFLPAATATFVVAALMAVCWNLARRADIGFWIVTPLVLSLPIAMAGYLAVVIGHCRNRVVALFVGLLAAAVMCLGQFHADLVREQGWQSLTRLDLLPAFVADRVANIGHAGMRGFLPRGEIYSWLHVSIEFLVAGLIVAPLAVYRSNWAYCEACRRWLRFVSFRIDAGIADEIAEAIRHRDLAAIPKTAGRGPFSSSGDWLDFEYCPNVCESDRECAAYLSLKEYAGATEVPQGAHAATPARPRGTRGARPPCTAARLSPRVQRRPRRKNQHAASAVDRAIMPVPSRRSNACRIRPADRDSTAAARSNSCAVWDWCASCSPASA